jgi:hypothetical protein
VKFIRKLIILIEIPKLSVPFSKSFKIENCKNVFYMYPGTFTQTLKKINDERLEILNDPSYRGSRAPNGGNFFNKDPKHFAYIASEINIDINIPSEEIFNRVKIFFRPPIILFSFFMNERFTINKVFLFEKKSWGYKFIQMLESPNFHKELSGSSKLKRFISQQDVEFLFPCILMRMCGKEHYLEFIDGYISGKTMSFFIGNEISNYWNCLEHFANKYCITKKKNKILKKSIKRQLNKVVNGALGLMKDDDVAFPNLTLNEIKSKGWLLADNRPPILNRIFYTFNRKRINLSNEEKKIIKIIYLIRNKLYHEENYLNRILGKLLRRFQLSLRDIGLLTRKFSLIVEKMILRFFKIIPNYFKLNQEEYYHNLMDIQINLPKLREKKQLERSYFDKLFNTDGLTEKEALLKHLIYDKKVLTQKGKYISIIKYLDRFKLKCKTYIQNNFLAGILRSLQDSLDVRVKLDENLDGKIEFLIRNKVKLEKAISKELNFISNINPTFGNYRLKFGLLIKEIKYDIGRNPNPVGKFFTLLTDIREISDT